LKRCKCLRFKDLQYLKRESRLWIWEDVDGLIPVECIYPLVEFDKGEPLQVCPYYLYLTDNMRISCAYYGYRQLNNEHREIIDDAVKNCANRISIDNIRFIEDRHAEILEIYSSHINKSLDREMFLDFYGFIQIRQKYLDISPCLIIPPIEHDDRMSCINECWIEAFKKYLEEKK